MSQSNCGECDGGIVYVEEGPSWWMGSGVYITEYPCPNCEATEQDEPADPAEEPVPSEEQQQAWAQADIDAIRRSDQGRAA